MGLYLESISRLANLDDRKWVPWTTRPTTHRCPSMYGMGQAIAPAEEFSGHRCLPGEFFVGDPLDGSKLPSTMGYSKAQTFSGGVALGTN
jgi:hypothetical protein